MCESAHDIQAEIFLFSINYHNNIIITAIYKSQHYLSGQL